ncbi:hypothetical protein INT44_008098 [Umbelopsis vinacea]|uniref:Ferrochelatase n=1 Tax=Umbelopsis vinacea TaxID=44442 RepID=A0A8H7PQU4_9FUNG|nr:hypothetical protein INT44_008098 [Umbelopsis vinacea]
MLRSHLRQLAPAFKRAQSLATNNVSVMLCVSFTINVDVVHLPNKLYRPTAILLTNMGGPATLDKVHSFLLNLFSDSDLMRLPLQSISSKYIARRRTPQIQDQYNQIGGGSPILHWTKKQGEMMEAILDRISPETAPHKHYIAFRYVDPLTADTVEQMKADGIKRAVVFTQYPQYSCSTTGSSLNELYRCLKTSDPENEIKWSVIDRWNTHPGFVKAVAGKINQKLAEYSPEERDDVLLLFSAHSLPMSVVNRGDPYPAEVAASVDRVMNYLQFKNPHRLVWQSQVGPSAWLGPQTGEAIKKYGEQGKKNIVVVPIAFTSDHIETLFELDIEYGKEAHEAGVTGFKRSESLNDDPVFAEAMADIVKAHLESGKITTPLMSLRCPSCTNDYCGEQKEFFANQKL